MSLYPYPKSPYCRPNDFRMYGLAALWALHGDRTSPLRA